MPSRYLITGATGFVGGHLAEACVGRGLPVTTIARPTSDTALLDRLGVRTLRGELGDPEIIRKALEDVEVVVHCAAKVGEWGPIEEYRPVNVDALRELLDACRGRPLKRFVHLSTLGVYAARHHYGTDESEPPPSDHMDAYTKTKVEAEQLVLCYHREHGVPVVVLRPGFVYGSRDRTLMPKIIHNLRRRRLRYMGGSKKALNTVYVDNLIDAIFLAIEKPEAVGQIYNLTDGEYVSKRRFIEAVVNGLGLPKPRPVQPPLWVARLVAKFLETRARLRGSKKAPSLTQAGLKFMGLNLDFSIEKAKRELGYRPKVGFDEGIGRTMAWYRENT